MTNIHKSPLFLTLVACVIFGTGYIAADDNRIERAQVMQHKCSSAATVERPAFSGTPSMEARYAALRDRHAERKEKK